MGILIAVILVCWVMSKAVSDAKLDHTYAKRGAVSPRLKAKYGGGDRAAAKCAKYGFTDFLRDAWRDYWPRRTDALIAARNMRTADGKRPRLWDRVRAGQNAVAEPPAAQPTTPTVVAAAPPVVPAGPAIDPAVDDPPTLIPDKDPSPKPVRDPEPKPVPTPTAPSNGGNSMIGSTGEAVNYETTIAEIDAQIADVQGRIDADNAALAAMTEAKAAVDAVQMGYQEAATAAQTKFDHQAALNLDDTTLGHAGTVVDAMPPNAVDGLYDQTELIEQMIQERLVQDEIALASLEAERAHLIGTYGDAHAIVSGNLGGNAAFLDSGGGSGGTTSGAFSGSRHNDGSPDIGMADHDNDWLLVPGSPEWTAHHERNGTLAQKNRERYIP